jgi:hypothetical protein
LLFLFYGIASLFFEGMRRDFERFGLSRLRTLVGTLEVLGALGLIVGQLWLPLVPFSAGGLALMMFVGVATRIRVMCINLFIAWVALGHLDAATTAVGP